MNRHAFRALLLSMLLAPCMVSAGECTRTEEEYLRILEQGTESARSAAPPSSGEISEALNCLVYWRMDQGRWAGPRTAAHFANLHHSPFRERFVAACTPYLLGRGRVAEAVRPTIAFEAATALAMCGVAESGGRDIFGVLIQGDPQGPTRVPFVALASLADRRTLAFLRARYDSLTSLPSAPDARYWKTQIVNCLYYLPGDSVVSFAEVIATSDPDTAVVARARHVLEARPRR